MFHNIPGPTRTGNPETRIFSLYPIELRGHLVLTLQQEHQQSAQYKTAQLSNHNNTSILFFIHL